jgi:hypothetical protein
MNGDVSFDLGSALPYLENRILSLFGKDSATLEWQNRLKNMIRLSSEQAGHVQCVGMHTPIPIGQIYQPIRLTRSDSKDNAELDSADLLRASKDAIILAGPGWGKTTLLHYLYCTLVKSSEFTAILFTLRWSGVTQDLIDFVDRLATSSRSSRTVILLVDGYDEISEEDRQSVSRALLLFHSLGRGIFLLTCRSFYSVYELKTQRYDLCAFRRGDAVTLIPKSH